MMTDLKYRTRLRIISSFSIVSIQLFKCNKRVVFVIKKKKKVDPALTEVSCSGRKWEILPVAGVWGGARRVGSGKERHGSLAQR